MEEAVTISLEEEAKAEGAAQPEIEFRGVDPRLPPPQNALTPAMARQACLEQARYLAGFWELASAAPGMNGIQRSVAVLYRQLLGYAAEGIKP